MLNVSINRSAILGILEVPDLPRKYQNPKLDIRSDVDRPYYFIRVAMPDPKGKRGRKRKILGFCDAITKKEAMKLRAEVLDVVNSGREVVTAQMFFRDLVKRFEEARMPHLGAATQARYRSILDNHIVPFFGGKKLATIDKAMIEGWLAGKDGLGWWSKMGLSGLMTALFKAAIEWKYTTENPAKGSRIGRKTTVRKVRALTSNEMRQIVAALDGQTRLIVLTIFVTGLRVSEVLGLKWKSFDFDHATVSVSERWYRGDLDVPKTESSNRTRQLGPLMIEWRALYPGPQAHEKFAFLGDDGLTPPDERDLLRYSLRPVLKRLGIYFQGFGWHQFRRENISKRQEAGATPIEAMKSAGHTKMDVTMLYTQLDQDRERDQVTAMFDRLIGIDGAETKQ